MSAAEQLLYEVFFCKEMNSDVTLTINGQTFNLHKEILCQGPYFVRLFSENPNPTEPLVIDILDTNVNDAGVHTTLALIYFRSYPVEVCELGSVVATAHFFEMDFIREICEPKIISEIKPENVCKWFEMSLQYELINVHDHCKKYLKWNFIEYMRSNITILKAISFDVMKLIISFNYLYLDLEMMLYTTLKEWMFLKLTNWSGDFNSLNAASDAFYNHQNLPDGVVFLETEDGKPFAPVFHLLRLQHCVIFDNGLNLLLNEQIIPKRWIASVTIQNFKTMLKTHNEGDDGPEENFSHEEFKKLSMRCGIKLRRGKLMRWQWNVTDPGIRLIFYSVNRYILMQWKCETNYPFVKKLDSRKMTKRFMYSIGMACKINDTIVEQRLRDICCQTFNSNQKLRILKIPTCFQFPIYIIFNLLSVVPYDKRYFLDDEYRHDVENGLVANDDGQN